MDSRSRNFSHGSQNIWIMPRIVKCVNKNHRSDRRLFVRTLLRINRLLLSIIFDGGITKPPQQFSNANTMTTNNDVCIDGIARIDGCLQCRFAELSMVYLQFHIVVRFAILMPSVDYSELFNKNQNHSLVRFSDHSYVHATWCRWYVSVCGRFFPFDTCNIWHATSSRFRKYTLESNWSDLMHVLCDRIKNDINWIVGRGMTMSSVGKRLFNRRWSVIGRTDYAGFDRQQNTVYLVVLDYHMDKGIESNRTWVWTRSH